MFPSLWDCKVANLEELEELVPCFRWQEAYGAFSYSHSQIKNAYNYILNQEKHHSQQTFQNEYLDFLKRFEIEHDIKYVFE